MLESIPFLIDPKEHYLSQAAPPDPKTVSPKANLVSPWRLGLHSSFLVLGSIHFCVHLSLCLWHSIHFRVHFFLCVTVFTSMFTFSSVCGPVFTSVSVFSLCHSVVHFCVHFPPLCPWLRRGPKWVHLSRSLCDVTQPLLQFFTFQLSGFPNSTKTHGV